MSHAWDEGIGEWDNFVNVADVGTSDELRALRALIGQAQQESIAASRQTIESMRRAAGAPPAPPSFQTSAPPIAPGLAMLAPSYAAHATPSWPPPHWQHSAQPAAPTSAVPAAAGAQLHPPLPPPPPPAPVFSLRDEALLRSAEAVEREAAGLRARALANLKGRLASAPRTTSSSSSAAAMPPPPSRHASATQDSDAIRSRAAVLAAAAAVAAVTAPTTASAVALFGAVPQRPPVAGSGALEAAASPTGELKLHTASRRDFRMYSLSLPSQPLGYQPRKPSRRLCGRAVTCHASPLQRSRSKRSCWSATATTATAH